MEAYGIALFIEVCKQILVNGDFISQNFGANIRFEHPLCQVYCRLIRFSGVNETFYKDNQSQ